jgi:ABC-2 type transport system permease protein
MTSALDPTSTPRSPNQTMPDLTQEILGLTKRLFIQLKRRPSTLAAGIVQPVMWLTLFGALFQNAPQGFLGTNGSYGQFVGAGIIVFTAFGGALNAGLPVMFDREFGFLNRLLVAPLVSRFSIVIASALFITAMSFLQTLVIMGVGALLGMGLPSASGLGLILLTLGLLILAVTGVSLGLAFALKGHIELIAIIFVTNLPLLFASTALAPLTFMPTWLQTIACLNPLSYAIESIRYAYAHGDWHWGQVIMVAPFGSVTIAGSLLVLALLAGGSFIGIRPLIQRKLG